MMNLCCNTSLSFIRGNLFTKCLVSYSKMAFEPINPLEIYKQFMTPEKRAAIEIEELERKNASEKLEYKKKRLEQENMISTLEASRLATEYAVSSSRPTFVTSPLFGDITPTIPHITDPLTGIQHPMYSSKLIKEASKGILQEIQSLYNSNPPLHNPWSQRDAFAHHSFFSFRNQLRYAFPGLGYAVIAFIIYLVCEWVYDHYYENNSTHLSLQETRIE